MSSKNPPAARTSAVTPKRIGVGVLALLALILVLTNFETTRVNLLIWHVNMPLALLLAVMFCLGWATNLSLVRMRQSKKK